MICFLIIIYQTGKEGNHLFNQEANYNLSRWSTVSCCSKNVLIILMFGMIMHNLKDEMRN